MFCTPTLLTFPKNPGTFKGLDMNIICIFFTLSLHTPINYHLGALVIKILEYCVIVIIR